MGVEGNKRELQRFWDDPKYREKVIARIHSEQDYQYKNTIKKLEKEKEILQKEREAEINKNKRIQMA